MYYTASRGETWDGIAYRAYGDEMLFPNIIAANRDLVDVVVFEGGERVEIPDRLAVENAIVASPFQGGATVTIITAPW